MGVASQVKSCIEGGELESITEESVKTGDRDRDIVRFLKGLDQQQMLSFHQVIQGTGVGRFGLFEFC